MSISAAAHLIFPDGWLSGAQFGNSLAGGLRLRDRCRGALIGLAVGDALGTSVEFRKPGTFEPVTDMVGGGTWGLKAGQWTDDTSMALCLAESLIERREFDPADQMRRYVRWWREGHLSSTGHCFDIGTTTSEALARFERTGEPYAGPTDQARAANGSLMRLAPVPIFFRDDPDVDRLCADSSRTTHGSVIPVDACRYLGALIVGALRGATREELLAPCYEPEPGWWDAAPLAPEVHDVAAGSFRQRQPPQIRGTGYSVAALEAALWALHSTGDFATGALLAVNLGDDADTTAAIYGQLAGAVYGETGIPERWRELLALRPLVDRYAELLFQLSLQRLPALSEVNASAARAAVEEAVLQYGGPSAALQALTRQAEESLASEGALEVYMGGPMRAHAVHAETLMLLRVEIGLAFLS